MTSLSGNLLDPDRLRTISKNSRSIVHAAEAEPADEKNIATLKRTVEDVLFTSNSATLDAAHRVAAWNTLSTVVGQSAASNSVRIQDLVWNSHVWSRAFEIYLVHAPNARPKSIQQLLTTLVSALSKNVDKDLTFVKQDVLHKLLKAILNFDDPYRAKVSTQFLGNLLRKELVTLDEVLVDPAMRQGPQVTHFSQNSIQYLLWIQFQWLRRADFGSSIAQLISGLLDKYDRAESNDDPNTTASKDPVWALPLEVSISYEATNTDGLRAHALPVLFRRSFRDFVSLLRKTGLTTLLGSDKEVSGYANEQLLCVALQSGNDLGLIRTEAIREIQQTSSSLALPVRCVSRLLLRESRISRLTGLSLLILCNSSLKPLPKLALKTLKSALHVFFADPDADFRSDVFGFFQRLLDRLRVATATQARHVKSDSKDQSHLGDHGSDSAAPIVAYHRQFMEWLTRFLTWELRPTASYQRHICTLKFWTLLVRSGVDPSISPSHLSKSALGQTRWPFHLALMTENLQNLLLGLLLDPFDDVRSAAAAIMAMYASNSPSHLSADTIDSALTRGTNLMLTSGRADQADGVAHLWALKDRIVTEPDSACAARIVPTSVLESLITKLEEMLEAARLDLTAAVHHYPMHGILTSIRYVMSQKSSSSTSERHLRLCTLLREVWEIVKPTLCNDAPEGFIPDELEVGSNSTKEILSYCWRALKEASLLLNVLIHSKQLTTDILETLCELCFTQLVELRHRGAFSTVAQTWVSCCARSYELRSSPGVSTPKQRYSNIVQMLENNITINTRRSAGLPSLLCGILIAESHNDLMESAMSDLERISRIEIDRVLAEEGALSQVHAMNCIKDILKNSRLGERSERYIPTTLQLAADALHSDTWAIRNCGLMLFRAVIDRLLGTSDSYFGDDATGRHRIAAEQFPELIEVVLGLLKRSSSSSNIDSVARNESVFPALQLLQYSEVPNGQLGEVRTSILALMANTSWHVRDAAARAYAMITNIDIEVLQDLLHKDLTQQNVLHGSLLAARHILTRIRSDRKSIQSLTNRQVHDLIAQCYDIVIDRHYLLLSEQNHSPVTMAAYLDVVRESLIALSSSSSGLGSPKSNTPDINNLRHPQASRLLSLPSLKKLLDDCIGKLGSATVVQALARLFAVLLVINPAFGEPDVDSMKILVTDIALADEDACVYLLSEVGRNLYLARQEHRVLISDLCEMLQTGDWDWELKIMAQNLVLRLSERGQPPTRGLAEEGKENSVNIDVASRTNQHYADSWLQVQAARLEAKAVRIRSSPSDEFMAQVIVWANDCALAIQGGNLFTHEAAANALDRIDAVWQLLLSDEAGDVCLQRLCLAVYDLLNDDEEDIRLQAAHITQRLLGAQYKRSNLDFEPITAGQRLLSFCIEKWSSGDQLIATAAKRAYGLTADSTISVADRLTRSMRTDHALFVEEKQNLYIDEARQVRTWSQALLKLSSRGMAKPLVKALSRWVVEGLDSLTANAETAPDGALGWSMNSEIFVLGLQVIYGAEVLLRQLRHTLRIPVSPSRLRRKLFEFLAACETSKVNCLWRWEIHRVLKESVLFKMQKTADLMNQVYRASRKQA